MATGGDVVQRLDSQNLRDFLRIKEEDHRNNSNLNPTASVNGGVGRSNHSGVTLHTFLSDKRRPPVEEPAPAPLERVQSNRTLLDIIREDQVSRRDGKRSWRQLKEKILLRRGGGGGTSWTSTVSVPVSDVPVSTNNRMMGTMVMNRRSMERLRSDVDTSGEANRAEVSEDRTTRPPIGQTNATSATSSLPRRSLQRELNEIRAEEEEQERSSSTVEELALTTMAEGQSEAEQPMRMSLMALLAETDRQMGMECSAYMMDEEEEEEDDATPASGGGYNNCCVCMVRHKGAAFIPCGHTFCRLCSRELWAQRGNCPLCNNYILEILDIF